MFVDVRDFTPFVEANTAEDTVARLNALFEIVVPAVVDAGGHVNKFLGDGAGWAHFGHTLSPQRSILVNHNECHFAAECRFGSETSTPKRVRFPAAP
jgi:class 3 adenylate cyclase